MSRALFFKSFLIFNVLVDVNLLIIWDGISREDDLSADPPHTHFFFLSDPLLLT